LEETKNEGEPLPTNGLIAEEDDQGENGVDD
jgi:hypothetical protein